MIPLLIPPEDKTRVLLRHQGRDVQVGEFVARAQMLCEKLPASTHILNLCRDRLHFMLGFAAAVMSKKLSLMPSSVSPTTLEQLTQQHPDFLCLHDGHPPEQLSGPSFMFPDLLEQAIPSLAVPQVEEDQVVSRMFTSGTTGTPVAYDKTWGKLVMNAKTQAHRLGLAATPHTLVATVPAQHMYGFESTVLLCLLAPCSIYSQTPYYPADIVELLSKAARPRILVSTPFHLSMILQSGLAVPPVDVVLSATAPLPAEQARQMEQLFASKVVEIYGSTETGQIASRQPTASQRWALLRDIKLEQSMDGTTFAYGGHIEMRVPLCDFIELQGNRHFILHGRTADTINIAGKRSSLEYLNHQLRQVRGVQDSVFFMSDETSTTHQSRLCAFVVAPGLEVKKIINELRGRIDPQFLPRPLILLDALPREATGKLPRKALQALYDVWHKRETP